MFSTDFIFRQQENLVDNQKCLAGFRLLCNKILIVLTKKKLQIKIKSVNIEICSLEIVFWVR